MTTWIGSFKVFRRGLTAMSRWSVLLLLPAGVVVGLCYLLIFGPAFRAQGYASILTLSCGLEALSILNGSFTDSMDPLYSRLRISRSYLITLETTPLQEGSLIIGDSLVSTFRSTIYALGVGVAILAMYPISLPTVILWTALTMPCGFILSMFCFCLCACVNSLSQLNIVRFLLLPMFLFSGAIIPLDGFPKLVILVAQWLPVWKISELFRYASLGDFRNIAIPTIYLLALGSVSYLISLRKLRSDLGRTV
ncbi:MAG: ABC transporter permease [Propionibacteriaceae bacterium]